MKNSLRAFLVVIVLLVVFIKGSSAAEAPTTVAAPGGWDGNVPAALPAFAAAPSAPQRQLAASVLRGINGMQAAGASMAGTLVPTGIKLLFVFYAITLVWYVYEGLASQQLDMLFKKMISHTIIAGIAWEMLLSWNDPVQGIGISNFLTLGMDALGAVFAQGGDPSDNVINAYYPAITSAFNIVYTSASIVSTAGSSTDSILTQLLAEFSAFGIMIVAEIVALISAGVLAIAMIYALFFANLGDFIIYIGLAVGPIFVATMVFPAAQGFFSKWLEFVISGGMYKLMAVVVGDLLAKILIEIGASTSDLIAINATLSTGGAALVAFMGVALLLIFWSLFAYFITKQIPHFVTALTGGANIHLGSLKSLAPHPPGSFPSFNKPSKPSVAETAKIKAAAVIQSAEIKSATAIKTATIKAAAATQANEIKAAAKVTAAAEKAAAKQITPKTTTSQGSEPGS